MSKDPLTFEYASERLERELHGTKDIIFHSTNRNVISGSWNSVNFLHSKFREDLSSDKDIYELKSNIRTRIPLLDVLYETFSNLSELTKREGMYPFSEQRAKNFLKFAENVKLERQFIQERLEKSQTKEDLRYLDSRSVVGVRGNCNILTAVISGVEDTYHILKMSTFGREEKSTLFNAAQTSVRFRTLGSLIKFLSSYETKKIFGFKRERHEPNGGYDTDAAVLEPIVPYRSIVGVDIGTVKEIDKEMKKLGITDPEVIQVIGKGIGMYTEGKRKPTIIDFYTNDHLEPLIVSSEKMDILVGKYDEMINLYPEIEGCGQQMTWFVFIDPEYKEYTMRFVDAYVTPLTRKLFYQIPFTILDNAKGEIEGIEKGINDVQKGKKTPPENMVRHYKSLERWLKVIYEKNPELRENMTHLDTEIKNYIANGTFVTNPSLYIGDLRKFIDHFVPKENLEGIKDQLPLLDKYLI